MTTIIGRIIGLIGFAVMLVLDWRFAIGMFLALWGNNIVTRPK